MPHVTLTQLETALCRSWSRETSYCPHDWSQKNPALGQCAVTALVVQDSFGGEIVWARVGKISHYFNRIDGEEIDLTRSQFPEDTTIPPGIERSEWFSTTREYVLSGAETGARYAVLKTRIEDIVLHDR